MRQPWAELHVSSMGEQDEGGGDSTMLDSINLDQNTTAISQPRPRPTNRYAAMSGQQGNPPTPDGHRHAATQSPTQQLQRQGQRQQHHSRAWDAQKEIWKLEQHIVASFVQIHNDPPVDTTIVGDNPLFQLVKHDHLDIFSFSSKPELYGGVTVCFSVTVNKEDPPQQEESENGSDDDKAVAVYVIIDKRTMSVVYQDFEYFVPDVPYMPEFVAFREIQPMERLIQRQVQEHPELAPAAILVTGHGVWHERRAGIACFLGQRIHVPTIGVTPAVMSSDQGGWTLNEIEAQLQEFVSEFHTVVGKHAPTLAPILSRYRGLILKKQPGDPNLNRSSSSTSDTAYVTSASTSTATATATTLSTTIRQPPTLTRATMLQHLAPCCNGIGIYLRGNGQDYDPPPQQPSSSWKKNRATDDDNNQTNNNKFSSVLACALVGQGGQIAVASAAQPVAGAGDPILISVGHLISLQRAVQICASLCVEPQSPLPEPVRQSALLAHSLLLRNRQQKLQLQQQQQQQLHPHFHGTRRSTM
jgi:deoxyinosine 3'endonuclease (endonuclease V)